MKSEWVHHSTYRTREEARTDLFYHTETFYNRCRLHPALDYFSPVAYELLFYQGAGTP